MGKNNLKAEKAKRNLEYARKHKKKRPFGRPRPSFRSSESGGEGGAPGAPSSAPSVSRRPMFKAICSACGAEASLPFEPTSGKPVYCQSCFQTHGQGARA